MRRLSLDFVKKMRQRLRMQPNPYDKYTTSQKQKIEDSIENAMTRVWKQKRTMYIKSKRGSREAAAAAATAASIAFTAGALAKEKGDWYFLDQEAKARKRKADRDRYRKKKYMQY